MTILPALRCASLIPQTYRGDLPGVGPLGPNATVGDLATKLDEQTMNLKRANGRTSDVIAIVDACDQRQAEVAEALKPRPWWKLKR